MPHIKDLNGSIFRSPYFERDIILRSVEKDAICSLLMPRHTWPTVKMYRCLLFRINKPIWSGSGSSVGIATELRAGPSGIESQWRRDFPPVQTGSGAHPSSYKMGTRSFPGVKCGLSVLLTTHPFLVPRSWKSRATPLPTLWVTPGL